MNMINAVWNPTRPLSFIKGEYRMNERAVCAAGTAAATYDSLICVW